MRFAMGDNTRMRNLNTICSGFQISVDADVRYENAVAHSDRVGEARALVCGQGRMICASPSKHWDTVSWALRSASVDAWSRPLGGNAVKHGAARIPIAHNVRGACTYGGCAHSSLRACTRVGTHSIRSCRQRAGRA